MLKFIWAGPSLTKTFSCFLCRLADDGAACVPSLLTLVVLLQTKSIPTVTPGFWDEKWAKWVRINWQSGGFSHNNKKKEKKSQCSICQPRSAWQHSSNVLRRVAECVLLKLYRKKSQSKEIIGFGSAWMLVCAQKCGCVCTAGACALDQLSREQGLAPTGTVTYKTAEDSLDACLSLSETCKCKWLKKIKNRVAYWQNTSARGRHFYFLPCQLWGRLTWLLCCSGTTVIPKKAIFIFLS